MSKVEDRVCCDVCGSDNFEAIAADGSIFIMPPPIEEGMRCADCNWRQNDYLLEHPDEDVKGQLEFEAIDDDEPRTLNIMRMHTLWRKLWPGKAFALYGYRHAIFKRWREAHPELGSRFDMSSFKLVEGEQELLTKVYPDDKFVTW
jgi:hypothetical protein